MGKAAGGPRRPRESWYSDSLGVEEEKLVLGPGRHEGFLTRLSVASVLPIPLGMCMSPGINWKERAFQFLILYPLQ